MMKSHYVRASKGALLVSISMVATMAAGAVSAQETAGGGTEEIIVTAQRRAERLQDVPVSIIAQSGVKLEQAAITSLRDMTRLAPGVTFAGGGLNVAPTIRGVFSAQSDPGNDGNIAIYVDGVYQASQAANSLSMPDLERVEILKGPQGTLFGRNAAGGAVRLFTVGPNMDEMKGQVTLGYGSFNEFVAKGYVTGPIVEGRFAASLSASHEQSDGYYRDIVRNSGNGGTEINTTRLKLLFKPTDELSIEVFGNYAYNQNNNTQSYTVLNASTTARTTSPGVVIPSRPYEYTSTYLPTLKTMKYEVGGKITLETGWGDLSNMLAWSHVHANYFSDGDLTFAPIVQYPAFQRQSDIQNELLFTSNKFGGFQFTAGAFYYGNTGRYDPLRLQGTRFGAVGLANFSRQRTDAYSGFGEASYDVTDALTLIAGVRYSAEKRHMRAGFAGTRGNETELGKRNFKSTTPRASIKYRFTDEGDNAYFTYSQGFKSGGFNGSGAQANPFLPEKITSYEAGIKTSPSRMISANVAVFYYDYENQQVTANNGFTNVTANAATSRMYGFDGDLTTRFSDEFTVALQYAYLNAKYRAFPNATVILPSLIPNCLCGNRNAIADLSGMQEPRAPKFTGGINANYQKEFSFGHVSLSANLYYSAEFNWDAAGQVVNPEYATLALTAYYTPTDSPFTFGAWGRNLTGAKYYAGTYVNADAFGVNYAAPAAGGFTVKYAF